MATSFNDVYDKFFGKITDDMYLEWTREDTENDVRNILLDAIPNFEFPRCSLEHSEDSFYDDLTEEEINILAKLMVISWLNRQIDSVENTRMKYSGSDFKLTSQASHLGKLLSSREKSLIDDRKAQRLYKRRTLDPKTGKIKSTWCMFGDGSEQI